MARMNEQELFDLVKVGKFFKNYCPGVSNFYHKYRKRDGNKNPIDFTDRDRELIKKGAEAFAQDLLKLKI